MRTFPDLRMRDLVWEVQRAQRLLDEGQHEAARELLVELRARARKLGVSSSYLAWALAVACDNLGELEMAFSHICEAVGRDPLSVACQRSFDIITQHLRTSLCDPERPPEDPSVERVYQLLVAAGEADVPSHLAMARHLAHTGRQPEALRLLDAVTLLSPVSRDAWVQKAGLARAMGDEPLAARCDAEAAAVASADLPFGVPAPPGATC